MSYLRHSLGGYPSAEKKSVYSTAPADSAKIAQSADGLSLECEKHHVFFGLRHFSEYSG